MLFVNTMENCKHYFIGFKLNALPFLQEKHNNNINLCTIEAEKLYKINVFIIKKKHSKILLVLPNLLLYLALRTSNRHRK